MSDNDDDSYEPVFSASLSEPNPTMASLQRPIPAQRRNIYNQETSNRPLTTTSPGQSRRPPPVPLRPPSKPSVASSPRHQRPVPPLRQVAPKQSSLEQSDCSKDISLKDLSILYGDSLPIQVQVTKGIYGDNDDETLSTADRYTLHLSRHRDQVKVEDRHNKGDFYIPLNSTIQFSVAYNPNKDEEEAMRGFVYPSVKDILRLSPLPQIVCATKAVKPKSGRPDSTLHAEEVLYILEAVKSTSSKNRRRLKVYSFADRSEKLLEERCEGHFSTKPQHVKLSLARIMKHLHDPFPLEVVLCPDSSTGSKLPSYLFSRVLHMTERCSDVFFVATTIFDEPSMEEGEPIEIPTNLDIEVRVIMLSNEESEQLKTKSKQVTDTIEGKYIKHYRYTNVTMQQYLTQAEIYAAFASSRARQESVTSLQSAQSEDSEHSTNIYETPQDPSTSSTSSQPKEIPSDESDSSYERPTTGTRLSVEQQVRLVERRVQGFGSDVSKMKLELSSFTATADKLREQYESLEGKIERQSELFQSSLEQMQKLQKELVVQDVSKPQIQPNMAGDRSTQDEQKNIEYLAALVPQQILQLLEVIGMGQYRNSFAQEGLSGDLLLECDEGILEHELGVSLKIHRIKLMKLITGKYSAEAFLKGERTNAKVYVD